MAKAWEAEIAAMLSHIGCISVPQATLQRVFNGTPMPPDERAIYENHPKVGARLLAKIPRLAGVAEAVALQDTRFVELAGNGGISGSLRLAASILKVALDFDVLVAAGQSPH